VNKNMVDLRNMSNDQLQSRLREITLDSIRYNQKSETKKQSTDTMFNRKLKREKARILTILNERSVR